MLDEIDEKIEGFGLEEHRCTGSQDELGRSIDPNVTELVRGWQAWHRAPLTRKCSGDSTLLVQASSVSNRQLGSEGLFAACHTAWTFSSAHYA